MSLATRIASVIPSSANRGCRSCIWAKTLSDEDLAAMARWVSDGGSMAQLWEICCADPDNPLQVSYTGFRNHIQRCGR